MMKSKLYALAAAAFFGLNANAANEVTADGVYYIQNVGSGLYLCGANNWGTRGSVSVQGDEFKLVSSNGAFMLQNLDLSSKDKNLGSNLYTDNVGTPWTVEPVSGEPGVFTIHGNAEAGPGYLAQNSADKGLHIGYTLNTVSEISNASKWRFLTRAEAIEAIKSATSLNPVDVSFLISNSNYSRNHSTGVWTVSSNCTNKNLAGGSNDNMCAESYHSVFTVSQTLDVPNGIYALTAQGFYRQDGSDNDNLPYFFANNEKVNVPLKTGSENSMATASTSFSSGLYTIEPIYVEVTDGTLNIGIDNSNNANLWVIFDNFQLTYYGEGASIAEIKNAAAVADYKAALELAQSYQSADMDSNAKTALNQAITKNTLSLSDASLTAEKLKTATDALNDAASAASAAAETYKAFAEAAKLIQDGGGKNVDLTSVIKNNSFESDFANWTNNGLTIQGNASLKKDGAKYAERWQPNGTFSVEQSVKLPTGYYDLTVHKRVRGITSASLYANANVKEFEIGDGTYEADDASASDVTLRFHLDQNSDVKIGVNCVGTGAAASWFAIDNFRLTYVGETISYDELVAVTGKMNNDIASAQTNAIAAFNANKTDATYEAAQQAIDAAGKSVKAYEAAAPYLTKASVLDAAGQASYAAAAKAFIDSYNNGTLVELDAATKASLDAAFVTATKAQTSDGADMSALAPATWACAQGNGPAPQQGGFETYMGGKDKCFVPGDVISQTISELKNGLYRVEIQYLTHLATWDGQVGSGDGIAQVYANDATINVEVIADNGGTIAPISIDALVKDGTLQYGIQNIGNGGSWYVAKFEKLTYVRELNDAEKADAPTAITLNSTSAALKPGQQTTLAVTKVTPDNATETVTWSSSDNNVATVNDGVVTAVGEGTATITATSTVDTSIKATATVTVAYPTELANANFASGTPIKDGTICRTAAKDKVGDDVSGLQSVEGWVMNNEGPTDNHAGGVFAYGSGANLGGEGNTVPAVKHGTSDNALGVLAVWSSTSQYTQTIKLSAGKYQLVVPTYNTSGTGTITNLTGVKIGENSYYSKKTSFTTLNTWEDQTVDFDLAEESLVTVSLGFTAPNSGSGSNPHLFFDEVIVKERPAEIAVTGISLDKTVAALNSANNSVALTATIAPADATNKDVTWISSDENVAKVDNNGVVTGVAPGKATITATSDADGEIKATATITTSYNETTALPTSKTVENADGSKTIYTLSNVNLIKNGAFEYGNPFFGWTNAAGSAVAADKFDSVDGTLVAKTSEGNGAAGSIATKWAIEKNATYVFGYRTKANAAGNSEFHKVSLTNDGTESVVVSDNNQPVGTAWTDVQYVFENTDYGFLQFRGRWLGKGTSFDDFYLLKVTKVEEVAAPAPTTPELAITDGTAVTAPTDKAYNMTYTRSFSKANSWQSLALPVEFDYNDETVEVAKFTDASVEEDGTTVINIAKVQLGEKVAANAPLLISAKTAGTKEIALGEAVLNKANENGQAIDTEGKVVITNVLTAKKTGIAGKYVMSGGSLKVVADNSNKLGVNRWYMSIDVPSGAEVRFRIEGFDGEEATGIASAIAESLGAKAYSINGAQVDASNAKGVYIQNGKKFIRK